MRGGNHMIGMGHTAERGQNGKPGPYGASERRCEKADSLGHKHSPEKPIGPSGPHFLNRKARAKSTFP